jgi:hypothetical protein
MALTENQWGRILALAWKDNTFKGPFEKDPAHTLRNHPRSKALLSQIGIGPSDPIVDSAMLSQSGPDFSQASPQIIDAVIRGNLKAPLPEDSWFWDSILKGDATRPDINLISLEEWGRIYARLWMDARLHEPLFQPFRATYGPQSTYLRDFEKDPAAVVNKLTNGTPPPAPNGPSLNITYTKGTTRLFVLVNRPGDWSDEQLEDIIDDGIINGQPVRWMVRKCC